MPAMLFITEIMLSLRSNFAGSMICRGPYIKINILTDQICLLDQINCN